MTIQNLIDKLNKIEDKTKTIGLLKYDSDWDNFYILNEISVTQEQFANNELACGQKECDYYI